MHIFVNHQEVYLKKGTSFDYVRENRLFPGSDDYSLSITFPLKDCPENQAVFGHINRADVAAQKVIFACEIRDKAFCKYGSIAITEITNSEVKAQFLEGRSEKNFKKTLDKIYINELDLGGPPTTDKAAFPPLAVWQPNLTQGKCVALPWVNDYSGNIQNLANYANGTYTWDSEKCLGLSWQPYLLHITKKICEAIEYEYDFDAWEDDAELRNYLICNTLPYAWDMPEFANALPHWTVEEYFEKLELFLGAEFDIDHRARCISFNLTKDVLAAKQVVNLTDIVDERTVDIDVEEESCDYQDSKNLVYKECDHDKWKYYCCDWFVKSWKKVKTYATMDALLSALRTYHKVWDEMTGQPPFIHYLFYAEDIKTYFIIKTISKRNSGTFSGVQLYAFDCVLQPVNIFGGRIVNDDEDADKLEIEFVPARIDETDSTHGRLLFLSFSSFDADGEEEEDGDNDPDNADRFRTPQTVQTLTSGEEKDKPEYYNCIYMGWYDGANYFRGTQLPYPMAEDVIVADDWSGYNCARFSMRLNDRQARRGQVLHTIDPTTKATFRFLSDAIPDPRSIFLIRGKRYLASKITATFTETGMSRLMKLECFPIKD